MGSAVRIGEVGKTTSRFRTGVQPYRLRLGKERWYLLQEERVGIGLLCVFLAAVAIVQVAL